ncbi:formyl transferase [Paenilisteria newyorkensis]|uniref:formyl transferase n=1 Tax=Listeria newyorkensis TaxID=1497681 RepID=UPI000669DB50|nr:formyl transferase [Listeria newyorkensis]KMT62181.1 formyl transferase domain-containing protein [Listeria newyorkensis]
MKIMMLAGEKSSSHAVYQKINIAFPISTVVMEAPLSKKGMIKRRAKRLGIGTVIGQVLFQLFCLPILKKEARERIQQIIKKEGIDETDIPVSKVQRVQSVNDENTIAAIQAEAPDLIIVCGTRIISKQVLESTKAPFINIHAGITPYYRGSHGGYWALVQQDKRNCGVTLHYIDTGIDTGNIIAQDKIDITSKDNFVTYPYLQLAKGIQLLELFLVGKSTALAPPKIADRNRKGKVFYQPTMFQYLLLRKRLGVK